MLYLATLVGLLALSVACTSQSAGNGTAPVSRDQRLAHAWAQDDWPSVIGELEPDQQRGTLEPSYSSALYGAYINQGSALLKAGNHQGALANAEKARALAPERPEAKRLIDEINPPSPTPTTTRPPPRWMRILASGNCPAGYPVKANPDSMIYHVPGGGSYDVLRNPRVQCFSTPTGAESAGYRAARN